MQNNIIEPENKYSSLIINEINYNSNESFDTGDWVEIYNRSNEVINLEEYKFKDSNDNHVFTFPNNILLNSESYLILCSDTLLFISKFPEVLNFIGNLGFSFNGNGEKLRLFDQENNLIDIVEYDDDNPWPSEPDGNGPTLELIDPFSDNSSAENWESSIDYGTPGESNI